MLSVIPFYIFLASLHTAGCIGDVYFCILVLLTPKGTLIEDRGVGLVFYQTEAAWVEHKKADLKGSAFLRL